MYEKQKFENMRNMAFGLHFPIVIPCLLERVVTYFNVYKKLEVID